MKKRFKNILQYEMILQDDLEEEPSKIGKRKTLELKPMDEEEAILQMELVDHDFYIFKNLDADNKICVAYKRKDGTYGIIDAE